MKTCVYVNVKNEKRIIEFVKYYYKIGIDYFIFFDDNSTIDVKDVLIQNNVNENNYSVLYTGKRNFFYGVYNTKEHWYNEIIPLLIKNNIDYVLHVDADEFLFLGKHKNISEMIESYQPFDSLRINWLVFGSNNIIRNKTDSIIRQFDKSSSQLSNYIKCLTKVKSICSDHNSWFPSPHVLSINNNCIKKNIFNEIVNNNNANTQDLSIKESSKAPIYIAHYMCQDITTFIDRKVCSKIFLLVSKKFNLTDDIINLIQNNKKLFAHFISKKDINDEVEINNIQATTRLPVEIIQFLKEYFYFINNNDIENKSIINFYLR
jgi:hypothetical protein